MALSLALRTHGSGLGSPQNTASITGTSGNTIIIFTFSTATVFNSASGASIGSSSLRLSGPGASILTAVATGSAGAITLSGGSGAFVWHVVEVTGGASTYVQSDGNNGTGTTATVTFSLTSITNNITVAHTLVENSTAAITHNSGASWTELASSDDNHTPSATPYQHEVQYKVVTTGETSTTSTWTGSKDWTIMNAEFSESGGAGASTDSVGMIPVGF